MYSYSTLGENYRFLSDKYDIWPINWSKSFSIVLTKFYDYVDKHVYSANEAILVRDLCIKLDSGDFSFFNIDELNEMVVLLCTALVMLNCFILWLYIVVINFKITINVFLFVHRDIILFNVLYLLYTICINLYLHDQ